MPRARELMLVGRAYIDCKARAHHVEWITHHHPQYTSPWDTQRKRQKTKTIR